MPLAQNGAFRDIDNSKFGEKRRLVNPINGITDFELIAENFAAYFSSCTCREIKV